MYHTYLTLTGDENMSNTSSAGAARKNNMGTGTSQTPAKKKHSEVMGGQQTNTYTDTAPSTANASAKTISSPTSSLTSTSRKPISNGSLPGMRRGPARNSNTERDSLAFPDDPKKNDNLKFYRNEIKSKPFPGAKIKDMLGWKGNFRKLENEHQYIQWLFPLPEGKGLNFYAQPLQQHEALAIQTDSQTKISVLRAYMMMLDFYGMELVSSDSGEVKRSKNYIEQFYHLNRSMHNYRRITRIIKSLGCLGFGHLQAPWVKFIINEALIERTLPKLNGGSMYHWIDAIADTKEREETLSYFLKLRGGSDVDFIDNDSDENMDSDVDSGHVVDNANGADRILGVDGGRQNDRVDDVDHGGSVNRTQVDNRLKTDSLHIGNSGHRVDSGHFERTSEAVSHLLRNSAAPSSFDTSINDRTIDPTSKVAW